MSAACSVASLSLRPSSRAMLGWQVEASDDCVHVFKDRSYCVDGEELFGYEIQRCRLLVEHDARIARGARQATLAVPVTDSVFAKWRAYLRTQRKLPAAEMGEYEGTLTASAVAGILQVRVLAKDLPGCYRRWSLLWCVPATGRSARHANLNTGCGLAAGARRWKRRYHDLVHLSRMRGSAADVSSKHGALLPACMPACCLAVNNDEQVWPHLGFLLSCNRCAAPGAVRVGAIRQHAVPRCTCQALQTALVCRVQKHACDPSSSAAAAGPCTAPRALQHRPSCRWPWR